jgi:predicted DNA-binding protein
MRKNDTKRFSRVTVDLSENAHQRLEFLEEAVGASKADLFREALRLYEWAIQTYIDGGDFYAVKDGRTERVVLLGSAPPRPRPSENSREVPG